MYIISVLLMVSILVISLSAAFIFKRKANKLKEQKPVLFIIYSLFIFFSPLILLDIYSFLLPENWVSIEYPYFFLIACLAASFAIRSLIIKQEFFYVMRARKENKDFAKIYSIFTTGLIITLGYPIFFMKGVGLKTYIAGFLILAFWIYFIYIALIVAKKQKMDGERSV